MPSLFSNRIADAGGLPVFPGTFVLGFVGRLQPEKNVRLLVEVEKLLAEENHRFLIIGDGPERPYLEKNLRRAEFTGTLKGEALSEAYANMDLFLFPSRTDTYGNVVQEALASGVPAIVTNQGGPQYIVDNGVTGIVARSDEHYVRCVHDLVTDLARHQQMRKAARSAALEASWDKVFDNVYRAYVFALEAPASEWRAPEQSAAKSQNTWRCVVSMGCGGDFDG